MTRERLATHFVVFVKENWKTFAPFIQCTREFMEKHFLREVIDNPLTEFGRSQYYRVASRNRKWINYQIFAHIEAGKLRIN